MYNIFINMNLSFNKHKIQRVTLIKVKKSCFVRIYICSDTFSRAAFNANGIPEASFPPAIAKTA